MSTPVALTRQQRYMTLAFEHISAVKEKKGEAGAIYGGLCHTFPVLVRTCGLCQALAFVEAKAAGGGDRGVAYTLLRDHVAAVLGQNTDGLLKAVRTAPVADYMRHTRTVIDAWIFYKRFAVSILKVESASTGDKEGAPAAGGGQ